MTRTVMLWAAAAALAAVGAPAHAETPDALSRAKERGVLTACLDQYNYPFSSSNSEPPGFDVEIVRAVAQRAGLRALYFWADTGTRGGLEGARDGSGRTDDLAHPAVHRHDRRTLERR